MQDRHLDLKRTIVRAHQQPPTARLKGILSWLQNAQLDPNFDTQACADVLFNELPVPSRNASPALQIGAH